MIKRLVVKLVLSIYLRFSKILRKLVPKKLRDKGKILVKGYADSVAGKKLKGSAELKNGVNLVGFITAETGLGNGCRALASALERAGIPWVAINCENQGILKARCDETTWADKIVKEPVFNVNIVHINPDVLSLVNMYLPKNIWNVAYNIGFYLWELPEIPDNWKESFNYYDEIWAPSQFITDALRKITTKPVVKVPYGVELNSYIDLSRNDYGLPENVFFFLVMYDINSTSARKNPYGAVKAFKMAFQASDELVGIVIKIINSEQNKAEVTKLKNELKDYKHVYFIYDTLSRDSVNGLINNIDCFVSLHRSEGFGLVMAEAMYLGKPVIATGWSSNIDFMNHENSFLINYSLKEIEKDYGPYKAGNTWAEPDYIQAVEIMKKLALDPAMCKSSGNAAREYIRTKLTHEACGSIIKNRLLELNLI